MVGDWELPSELWALVLTHLNARDLCHAAQVCHSWRALADHDSLWRVLCMKRWVGKFITPSELFYRANFSAPSVLVSLTTEEKKTILQRRQILATAETDLDESIIASTPSDTASLCLGTKWKASYAGAELDAFRQEITVAELISREWSVQIKYSRPQTGITCQFTADAIFLSNNRSFPWHFVNSRHIQVSYFEALHVSRVAEDWGWHLENHVAILTWLSDEDAKQPRYYHNHFNEDEEDEDAFDNEHEAAYHTDSDSD